MTEIVQRGSVPFGFFEVPTYIARTACGVTVEAGAGNGLTYFRIQGTAGKAVSLSALDRNGNEDLSARCAGFDVSTDAAPDDVIEALKTIVQMLEEAQREV